MSVHETTAPHNKFDPSLAERIAIFSPKLSSEITSHLEAWPYSEIFLVAHRGAGKRIDGEQRLAPENTVKAMQAASRSGFRAVEFDLTVNLHANESPTVFSFHSDDPLERITNGTGFPFDKSWQYLQSLEIAGEKIPNSAEMAAVCRTLQLTPLIEIKVPYPEDKETSKEIGRIIAHDVRRFYYDFDPPPALLSFSDDALIGAGDFFPRIRNIRGSDQFNKETLPGWITLAKQNGYCGLDPDQRLITSSDLVTQVQNEGLHLISYLANDFGNIIPEEDKRIIELSKWGVEMAITDLIHRVKPHNSLPH